ncbi:MAG: DUF5916 domain-containing protein, partial [Bacteroidota bacterium]
SVFVLGFIVSAQNIVKLEYSVNEFVTEGNGTIVDLPGDSEEVDFNFNIDISNLAPGAHTIFFRTQNEDGVWSFMERRGFYIPKPVDTYEIVAYEYLLTEFDTEEEGEMTILESGTTLVDKSNTLELDLSGAFNQLYLKNNDADEHSFQVEIGSRYRASVSKIRGNFQFRLLRLAINPNYNDNDLGLTHRNNEITDRTDLHYNIMEPFWLLRRFRNRIRFQNQGRYNNYGLENMYVEYSSSITTLNYTSVWQGVFFHPADRTDYYEPRTPGRTFVRPRGLGGWTGLSSDYRKPFALDLQFNYSHIAAFENTNLSYRLTPRYRFNDQFSFVHSLRLNYNINDIGFAGLTDDQIVFGSRDVTTIENVFSSDYIVRNDMYFSFRLRQYWSKGEYAKFFALLENGKLTSEAVDFASNHDFNFNSFNIDLVFTWLFAPGSSLNVVWKNAILHEQSGVVSNYFDNFGLLLDSPQYNSLSLKILYHLDYQQIMGGA